MDTAVTENPDSATGSLTPVWEIDAVLPASHKVSTPESFKQDQGSEMGEVHENTPHHLIAGQYLSTMLEAIKMSTKEFSARTGVPVATLEKMIGDESDHSSSFRKSTYSSVLQGLKDLADEFREELPEVAELTDETREAMVSELLPADASDRKKFALKVEYLGNQDSTETEWLKTLRNEAIALPSLNRLIDCLDTAGLISADNQSASWTASSVQEAREMWVKESLKLGRSAGVAEAVAIIQLAGFETGKEELRNVKAKCDELGVVVPSDTELGLSDSSVKKLARFQTIPFAEIQPLLTIAANRIGEDERVYEIGRLWDQDSSLEALKESIHSQLWGHFVGQGWSSREIMKVVGEEYTGNGYEKLKRQINGLEDKRPFRPLALVLCDSVEEAVQLDQRYAHYVYTERRIRGNSRTHKLNGLERRLWGVTGGELKAGISEANEHTREESSISILNRLGEERARQMLIRWIELKNLTDSISITRNVCAKISNGKGDGTSSLEKSCNTPASIFKSALDEDDPAPLPHVTLGIMLREIEGIERIPAPLEFRNRLATGDALTSASKIEGMPLKRMFLSLMRETQCSKKHFMQSLKLDTKEQGVLTRLWKSLKDPDGVKTKQYGEFLTLVASEVGKDAHSHIEPMIVLFGTCLLEHQGQYPEAIAAFARELLASDDSDQMTLAEDLLELLYEPNLDAITPFPELEQIQQMPLSQLADLKMQICSERRGATWSEDGPFQLYSKQRRYATVLRAVPGVNRDELASTVKLLESEIISHRGKQLAKSYPGTVEDAEELYLIIKQLRAFGNNDHDISSMLDFDLDKNFDQLHTLASQTSKKLFQPIDYRYPMESPRRIFPITYSAPDIDRVVEVVPEENETTDQARLNSLSEKWQRLDEETERRVLAMKLKSQHRRSIEKAHLRLAPDMRETLSQLLESGSNHQELAEICEQNSIPEEVLEAFLREQSDEDKASKEIQETSSGIHHEDIPTEDGIAEALTSENRRLQEQLDGITRSADQLTQTIAERDRTIAELEEKLARVSENSSHEISVKPAFVDLPESYEPHPDDLSGVAFDRHNFIFQIGEYLEGYDDPIRPGITMLDPASISAARAVVVRDIAAGDLQEIADLIQMVIYPYGTATAHEGHQLLLARIKDLEVREGRREEIQSVMDALSTIPRAINRMAALNSYFPNTQVADFICSYVGEEQLSNAFPIKEDVEFSPDDWLKMKESMVEEAASEVEEETETTEALDDSTHEDTLLDQKDEDALDERSQDEESHEEEERNEDDPSGNHEEDEPEDWGEVVDIPPIDESGEDFIRSGGADEAESMLREDLYKDLEERDSY